MRHLGILLALQLLVGAASEEVVSLDLAENSMELANLAANSTSTDLSSTYISLQSDDWEDDDDEDAKFFVRHLGSHAVLTTLGGPIDRRNGAWIVKPPVCQPGFNGCPAHPTGAGSCISLEAADDANLYLAKDRIDDEIKMRRYPFVDAVSGVFCIRPGHANPQHISLEALGKPGFFVTHKDFKLALCNNKPGTACGVSDRFSPQSTFAKMPAKFFGTCRYEFKGGKKFGSPTCKCIDGYVGKNCDLGCDGGCGDGVCTESASGPFCECTLGHVGANCQMSCAINPVTGTACGGRGKCVLQGSSPSCHCGKDFKGASCEFHCPGYDEKDGVCGGKGTCELVESPGPDEPPTRCKCEHGRMGGSCGLRCPMDPVKNRVCSNHGTCDLDAESGKTLCNCQHGFAGEYCEYSCPANLRGQVCNARGECAVQKGSQLAGAMCLCEPGFAGPGCQAHCPGMLAGVACSGHGRCAFVGDATVPPRERKDEEQQPKEPKQEPQKEGVEDEEPQKEVVQDEEPQKEAPKQDEVRQEEEGKQQQEPSEDKEVEAAKPAARQLLSMGSKRKAAVCTCGEGYGGEDCGIACARDENGSVCTGHGKCNMEGECVCASGFVGPACQAGCPGTAEPAATACNENGDCMFDPHSLKAKCSCNEGFKGPSCKLMCPRGGAALDICSARGKCVVQRGVAVCICEEGFLGDNCGLACPGAEAGSVCGEHGHCEMTPDEANTQCLCQDGFLGLGCTVQCPGTGEDGRPCNGQGECKLNDSGTLATCTCTDGYLGADCGLKCPTDLYGNICAGVGKCVEKQHDDGLVGTECICEPGFVNFNCDSSCPRNSADEAICSGHGECQVTESTDISGQSTLRGTCSCHDGFLGDDCSHGCPSEGVTPCTGHGVCSFRGGNSACECESGWVGSACADRACVSQGSVFLGNIDKCQCESGYTCCSRENPEQVEERDETLRMMMHQKKLAESKLAALVSRQG